LDTTIVERLDKFSNDHVKALLIQAFIDGRIDRKPKLVTPSRLQTTDDHWLSNLVASSQGFTKAKFSGDYATEFTHLANKHIKLIDIEKPVKAFQTRGHSAISRSRYGYDDSEDEDDMFGNGDFNFPDLDEILSL
jgi:hypothetical protein